MITLDFISPREPYTNYDEKTKAEVKKRNDPKQSGTFLPFFCLTGIIYRNFQQQCVWNRNLAITLDELNYSDHKGNIDHFNLNEICHYFMADHFQNVDLRFFSFFSRIYQANSQVFQ